MLPAIGLTSAAFGVSVLSAVFPLVSVEIFVVGLVMKGPHLPWWLLAVVITVGQIGGKLLHYYAARDVIRLPAFLRGRNGTNRSGRWRGWLERFRSSCHRRPVWTGGVLLVSAAASVPPFLALTVAAGWARIPLYTFLITGFVGRFTRFTALILAPGVLAAWV
ncbi:membrane protein YqaA with SNARE-associated domain [Saccharopolyspora lacisalsi]|uniref:Membrane protein YqaA with SNARE-associated domain n=1 Tax=Halosaccharopolyspora lacisalsi TaxID=1000566 RepID=A0A839DRM7_9PSEU|nr:hypothetical protein [Halosaccharopolyspora lacisalsi]MBA8823379.1 membrane protein YqaA with SNARE-associated domain [Halosaccharopolyspora lacisalsi]